MINLYNANTEFYGTCYKAIIEEGKEKKKKLTAIKKVHHHFSSISNSKLN